LGALDLDISDAVAVAGLIQPRDVVVNCAAYTAVDVAETDVDAAYAANEAGPRNLARACALAGARLIHLSTDYVFDGTATTPYDVDATPAPVNVYGKSKLAGEQLVRAELPSAQIVRTAWVYTGTGSDFVAVMLRKLREGSPVRVVADQLGSPTYAGDLAAGLLELAATPNSATLLHATGAGVTSWYELARAVFKSSGVGPTSHTAGRRRQRPPWRWRWGRNTTQPTCTWHPPTSTVSPRAFSRPSAVKAPSRWWSR